MFARILSVAFVCLIPGISLAQLPSQHFSSINYLGRYLGFGYSDGYHACKDGRCTPNGQSKNWDSISSFYGSPTLPPSNRLVGRQPVVSSPIYNQGYCAEPIAAPALQSHMVYPMQNTMSIEMAPTTTQPSFQPQSQPQSTPQWSPTPLNFEPFNPPSKSSQTSPSDRGTYEAVPSAPMQAPSSGREREKLDLPAPLQRPDSNSPEAQYRRIPPGSYSLIQPTSFRAR